MQDWNSHERSIVTPILTLKLISVKYSFTSRSVYSPHVHTDSTKSFSRWPRPYQYGLSGKEYGYKMFVSGILTRLAWTSFMSRAADPTCGSHHPRDLSAHSRTHTHTHRSQSTWRSGGGLLRVSHVRGRGGGCVGRWVITVKIPASSPTWNQ